MSDDRWRARALIDTGALRHNLALARRRAPGCKVMAVVKSNAYGHGLDAVSRAIAGEVDAFAVATLEEGIACRNANPATPVTVLSGLHQPAALEGCGQHRLDPVLHTPEHLRWLEHYRAAPLAVWLKIDTGMNRLGIAPGAVADAIARLRRNPRVESIRLMSHLANADDLEDAQTARQLERFRRCTDGCELARSLANSAAVMKWPQTHLQWVRPGIMLYGGSPLLGCDGARLGLKPVMQLEARLLAVKTVQAGQPVVYGGDFETPAPMRIGVVGFGYGDGYPRTISPAAEVWVGGGNGGGDGGGGGNSGGRRAPVIGRVAMDMITVDLSHCAEADAVVGRRVVLWGDEVGVDEVANWAGTIAYELLCKVGARVPRVARVARATEKRADGET